MEKVIEFYDFSFSEEEEAGFVFQAISENFGDLNWVKVNPFLYSAMLIYTSIHNYDQNILSFVHEQEHLSFEDRFRIMNKDHILAHFIGVIPIKVTYQLPSGCFVLDLKEKEDKK